MQGYILIIEDEAAIADFLQTSLQCEGFRAAWAADGAIALSMLDTARPDLILLDLLLARRTRPTATPPHAPDDVLTALPFPAALVNAAGAPVAVNTQAAPWLDGSSRLAQPLATLARRVAASHDIASAQMPSGAAQSLVCRNPQRGTKP